MNKARIIYMLIMLIASQSVWSMLDEHSFSADNAAAHEDLLHDSSFPKDVAPPIGGVQESAENCLHCCHCHFHQILVIPLAAAAFDALLMGASPSFKQPSLADAHVKDLLRPPIL